MANRETRKEQYEDALFALLMDEMAQEDGKELLRLNEQLKQDPGAAVPEAVQRRCERVIGGSSDPPGAGQPGGSAVSSWQPFWVFFCLRRPLLCRKMCGWPR